MEVTSSSTTGGDRIRRTADYGEAGIPHYWLFESWRPPLIAAFALHPQADFNRDPGLTSTVAVRSYGVTLDVGHSAADQNWTRVRRIGCELLGPLTGPAAVRHEASAGSGLSLAPRDFKSFGSKARAVCSPGVVNGEPVEQQSQQLASLRLGPFSPGRMRGRERFSGDRGRRSQSFEQGHLLLEDFQAGAVRSRRAKGRPRPGPRSRRAATAGLAAARQGSSFP